MSRQDLDPAGSVINWPPGCEKIFTDPNNTGQNETSLFTFAQRSRSYNLNYWAYQSEDQEAARRKSCPFTSLPDRMLNATIGKAYYIITSCTSNKARRKQVKLPPPQEEMRGMLQTIVNKLSQINGGHSVRCSSLLFGQCTYVRYNVSSCLNR
jgi:hypothetical protein